MELWKPILGFERYLVSNYGNVKNVKTGKLLGVTSNNPKEYINVTISDGERFITKKLHKIVAIAFIPKLEDNLVVNHIDGNKHNNHANNLEWCTPSENIKHAYRLGLNYNGKNQRYIMSQSNKTKRKPVVQLTMDNEFVREWEGVNEIERTLKISHISHCCNGKLKSSGGFKWVFKKDYI